VGRPTSVSRPNAAQRPNHSLTAAPLPAGLPGLRDHRFSVLFVRSPTDRRASTPDPVTVWMAVAGSGVTQPEAALELGERRAACRCRRFLARRMRARRRHWTTTRPGRRAVPDDPLPTAGSSNSRTARPGSMAGAHAHHPRRRLRCRRRSSFGIASAQTKAIIGMHSRPPISEREVPVRLLLGVARVAATGDTLDRP